jgi:hypothetical protein
MYSNSLRALIPCLFLAVTPLLMQCGGAAGIGTETGNPPGIIQQKLYLEQVAGGIRVVGTAGAITPPGAAVRVTNLTSGTSVETSAGADGSLDVVVMGAAGDEYEVTASSGGQGTSERISFGEIARRPDLGAVSCPALESTLYSALSEVFDGADAACTVDADCGWVGWGFGCYFQCGASVLSRAGAAQLPAAAQTATAPVCAALEACERPAPSSCPGGEIGTAVCRAGQCQPVEQSTVGCTELLEAATDRRQQLRAQVDRTCSVDGDCRLGSLAVSCVVDCQEDIAVSATALEPFESSVRYEVENAYCQTLQSRGCESSIASCELRAGPPEAFCNAGACAIRYGE